MAVGLVVEEVKRTGSPIGPLVRDMWPRIDSQLEPSCKDLLAQEGLAVRASGILRRPETYVRSEAPERAAFVVGAAREPTTILLSVTVLEDTVLAGAGGERKPIIRFTCEDGVSYIEATRTQIAGLERHAGAMQFIVDSLTSAGVREVGDLPREQREAIAERWEAAREGVEVGESQPA